MVIKGLQDEDFVNYCKPSMMIIARHCSFKCDKESGVRCCQNSTLASAQELQCDDATIIERYLQNPITEAIILGGLEPFDQFDEVLAFVRTLRRDYKCDDDVVIYTGYNKDEIKEQIATLTEFNNIIVKYGRFVPGQRPHFDVVLGVKLASDNQYAERI